MAEINRETVQSDKVGGEQTHRSSIPANVPRALEMIELLTRIW
jgi:hypothetical protein